MKMDKRYMGAYGALYGNGVVRTRGAKRSLNLDNPSEFYEHVRVATWLVHHQIPFYHVPNGGYRKKAEAHKFKMMGVFSGVPDLCILVAKGGWHGLYVEVKRIKGGKLSDSQSYWGKILGQQGYCFCEGHGFEQCIGIIRDYIDEKNKRE